VTAQVGAAPGASLAPSVAWRIFSGKSSRLRRSIVAAISALLVLSAEALLVITTDSLTAPTAFIIVPFGAATGTSARRGASPGAVTTSLTAMNEVNCVIKR